MLLYYFLLSLFVMMPHTLQGAQQYEDPFISLLSANEEKIFNRIYKNHKSSIDDIMGKAILDLENLINNRLENIKEYAKGHQGRNKVVEKHKEKLKTYKKR